MFESPPFISVCPSGAGNAIRDKIMLLCSVSSVVCCPADLKILSVQKLRPMHLSNSNINSQWIVPILFCKDNMLMQPILSNLPTKLNKIFFALNWSADQKLKTLLTWRAWPVQMVGITKRVFCKRKTNLTFQNKGLIIWWNLTPGFVPLSLLGFGFHHWPNFFFPLSLFGGYTK